MIEDIEEIREIYGAPSERAVKKQLPRLEKHSRAFHRALAVSGHRLLGPVGPLRRLAKGRRAGLCPGARRRDPADPRPARQQPGRHDRQSLDAARRRADLLRARAQRDLARQRPGAHHHRSGVARTARRQRQGAAQRHPGHRRGSLFPLRQGADPLRFVEPGKADRRGREFPSLGRIIAEQIGGVSVEESERYTAEGYRTRLY